METMPVSQPGERRRGRADDANALARSGSSDLGELQRQAPREFFVARLHPDQPEPGKRRIAELLAVAHLALDEAFYVVARRERYGRAVGLSRLDQHQSGSVATPGAPGNLHQQMKGALRSSKVGD